MRTTKKILLALVLALCVAAVLSVCAFAALNFETDLPSGVQKGDANWVDSGYADVDTEDGWYMIGINNNTTYKVSNGQYPKLANLENARFYWNKTTGESVYLLVSNLTGNSGTNTVIDPSAMDVQSGGRQKLYMVACIFVDLAESKKGAFSVNPNGYAKDKKTEYPVWARYASTDSNGNTTTDGNKSKASTGYWSKVTATADEYARYAAQKAVFVEQGLTGTALEDALVEWVNANITGATLAANCLFEGAYYNMGWIFKQLENNGYVFESMEIRRATSGTPATTFGTAGLVLQLIEAKKILIDSDIVTINFTNTSRGLFMYVANLKTLASVSYDKTKDSNGRRSGAYTNKVTEGVIDLSGFSKATPYSDNGYAFSQMFRESGVENVIYFDSIMATAAKGWIAKDAELAGLIDVDAFRGCTSLKTVTLTAPLTKTAANAFYGATSLEVLYLCGGVAEGATIHENTFNQIKKAITVYVYSMEDAARAVTAFSTVTNIKINVVTILAPEEKALTADGYSIRVSDENAKSAGPALRAEFTLSAAKVAEAKEQNGLDLVDYGVVIFSENTFKNLYDESIDAIMAAVIAGENTSKIIRKSAFNGPYVRDYANGDVTFAAAITGIGDENYDSAVYTYAYAAWTDGAEVKYTYTTYISSRVPGKSAHSLYDATIFAFANGIVNSQLFNMSNGVELWDILEKGAFSVKEGEQKAFATTISPNVKYEFVDDDGNAETAKTFTYLNLPLYAWSFYKSSATGSVAWDGLANDLEATSSTNVVWSLLKNGDELVAVYRRDPNAAANAVATLPQIRDRNAGGFAPFSSSYFTPSKNSSSTTVISESPVKYGDKTTNGFYKNATIHSPILSDDNEALITTLVLDYGINKMVGCALENTTVNTLKTIVYPEGVTAGKNILNYAYHVENIIYATANKDYYAKVDAAIANAGGASAFGAVADLSGLSGLHLNYAFSYAQSVQNVLLPSFIDGTDGLEEPFRNALAIKRVWSVNDDVPADGTINLTCAKNARSIAKNGFSDLSNNAAITTPTIILPKSFEGISSYGYAISELDPCTRALGYNRAYVFVIDSLDVLTAAKTAKGNFGLLRFYDKIQYANNDYTGNGALGTSIPSTNKYYNCSDGTTLKYETKDSQTVYLNQFKFACEIDGVMVQKTIVEWREYCITNKLYESIDFTPVS